MIDEQKPVAWIGADSEGDPNKSRLKNLRGSSELYTPPPPDVVAQLVEALEKMTSVFLDTEGNYGSSETEAIDLAYKALAAAREAGL